MRSNQGILLAHIAVLLFGLSGVLAKLISQSAVVVTGGRSLIGAMILGIFLCFRSNFSFPNLLKSPALIVSGILLAVHWVAFYYSIKVSSVSIGVVAVSTFPVMTAIAEPIVMKEKWKWSVLFEPVLVLIGTIILLGNSPTESDVNGMLFGFLAAFIYVIIHLINKIYVVEMDGSQVSFIQLAIAGLVLLPFSIAGYDSATDLHGTDIPLLLVLALFCTAIAYSLFIQSLRSLPARIVAVLTGLEPVYAITIALLFLGEEFSWNLIIGAAIILFSVVRSSSRKSVETESN